MAGNNSSLIEFPTAKQIRDELEFLKERSRKLRALLRLVEEGDDDGDDETETESDQAEGEADGHPFEVEAEPEPEAGPVAKSARSRPAPKEANSLI